MRGQVTEERIAGAKDYRERASFYLRNFEEERRKGDQEKAGEFLWGVVSCLLNAFYILKEGKPASKHGILTDFAKQFLISSFEDGEELYKIYRMVEKFHANFYHAFLDKEEFEQASSDILRLVERLDQTLVDRLREIGF